MKYHNKKVLITGASSGIGEAIAYAFAKEGAFLILAARNIEELERVKSNCIGAEHVVTTFLDISDHDKVFTKMELLINEFGPIDVLVNNAGISQRSLAINTYFEVEKQMIDVNLLGTIAVTKGLLPTMITHGKAEIVVISSIMGKLGGPLRSAYAASKHGLHGFFDTLRAEHYKDGLKVLIVCPGYIKTNISINALTGTGKPQATMDEATGKGYSPEYIANKILKALKQNREEIVVAKGRERMGVVLKRFFPGLLSRIIRKAKTV
ncbi:putative oxidoreductase SadH [compost metagenome]